MTPERILLRAAVTEEVTPELARDETHPFYEVRASCGWRRGSKEYDRSVGLTL